MLGKSCPSCQTILCATVTDNHVDISRVKQAIVQKLNRIEHDFHLIKHRFDFLTAVKIDPQRTLGSTLRAAQKEPEKYRDLTVKVAGYSAFFTQLYKELQDSIIARTEHGL